MKFLNLKEELSSSVRISNEQTKLFAISFFRVISVLAQLRSLGYPFLEFGSACVPGQFAHSKVCEALAWLVSCRQRADRCAVSNRLTLKALTFIVSWALWVTLLQKQPLSHGASGPTSCAALASPLAEEEVQTSFYLNSHRIRLIHLCLFLPPRQAAP